ncbi:MAG: 2-C-methyl-D-erythritol 4-phosphate cytidylyltransferase [Chlamydiota bacterium]|jgi:2-C-methyl-D-erythritol 4-phosphate cytidylyltransferase
MSKNVAILLAAGQGVRFKEAIPKQFQRLIGKPIYLHTLQALIDSLLFSDIILVVPLDFSCKIECPYPHVHIVTGGTTRQLSSYQGLLYARSLNPDIVLIHDAVRPFVTESILKENLEMADRYGAANTCILSTDTLVYSQTGTSVDTIPLRKHFLRGQTPQTFRFPLILEAHEKCIKENQIDHTDDCSLITPFHHNIYIVQGSEENIKITTPLDLTLAEQICRMRQTVIPTATSSLEGKRIAVTGGSGGIGKELCRLLEQEGAIPLSIARSSSLYPADLSCPYENQRIFEKVGPLDGLINSIGYLKKGNLHSLTSEEICKQYEINLLSVIYSCKHALLRKNAHILNIASSSYLRGKQDYTIYSSSKAALVNFGQGLADERPDLYVNTLSPSRANTPLRTLNFPGEDPSTLLAPEKIAIEAINILKTKITGMTISL